MDRVWIWGLVGFVLVSLWVRRHELARRLTRRKVSDGYQRLLDRTGVAAVGTPLGKTALYLASYPVLPVEASLPHGARWTYQTQRDLQVLGEDLPVRVAAFEWSWKTLTNDPERQQRRRRRAFRARRFGQHDLRAFHRSSVWNYLMVGAVDMPMRVPRRITVTARSNLRVDSGGMQLESSEFNRLFHVEASDRAFVLEFLTPHMQHTFVEKLAGRNVHVEDGLLLMTGEPTHRDESLPEPISFLPAVHQDMRMLMDALSPQFWRACARLPQYRDD